MLHVRFERSDGVVEKFDEDVVQLLSREIVIGPFEWVQMTYNELRVSPDGDTLAILDRSEGVWYLASRGEALTRQWSVGQANFEHPFSDVVVYS